MSILPVNILILILHNNYVLEVWIVFFIFIFQEIVFVHFYLVYFFTFIFLKANDSGFQKIQNITRTKELWNRQKLHLHDSDFRKSVIQNLLELRKIVNGAGTTI